jgi:hypothetical protein
MVKTSSRPSYTFCSCRRASRWALPLPGGCCSGLWQQAFIRYRPGHCLSLLDSASVCFALQQASQVNQKANLPLLPPRSWSMANPRRPQDAPPVEFGSLGAHHLNHTRPIWCSHRLRGSRCGRLWHLHRHGNPLACSNPPPIPAPVLYHT